MKDKKLYIAALLLPITVLCAGAAAFRTMLPASDTVPSTPTVSAVAGETCAEIAIEVKLTATDADDDVALFQLTEQPRLGTAAINGDTLRYTPGSKTGTDRFAYTAVDTRGNAAPPADITIKVTKNRAGMTYADMDGNPAHYAALQLSARGVMTGEKIGGSAFFRPTQAVTRSEFIAMTAAAADLPLSDTAQTDFADDSGLSPWVKPYVSTAASSGLVCGYVSASGVSEIRGQKSITLAEGCEVLGNLLRTQDTYAVLASTHSADMDWAQAAVSNLARADVLPASLAALPTDTPLDRQTACALLYRAMCLMED